MPPTERCPLRLASPAAGPPPQERAVERIVCKHERHVHPRSAIRVDRVAVEIGRVDRGVQLSRPFASVLCRRLHARPASFNRYSKTRPCHVPGEARRRVAHRTRLVVNGGIVEEARVSRPRPTQQVLPDDDQRNPGRADVLLCARVDDAEPADTSSGRDRIVLDMSETSGTSPASGDERETRRRRSSHWRSSAGRRRRRWSASIASSGM